MEFRKAFLSLRWLIIILTCYLTLFSDPKVPFGMIVAYAILFVLTNLALTLVPRAHFADRQVYLATDVADILFMSAAFFLLSAPGNYLHVAFTAVFIMAVISRDLLVALFSIGAVSVLYGAFTLFRSMESPLGEGSMEGFLKLALLFLVADFYVFLSARLKHDSTFSCMMREGARRAEVMGEITRSLSSSLDSKEILSLIVTRLAEVANAADVLIVQITDGLETAEIVVRSSEPHTPILPVALGEYPGMLEALESHDVRFATGHEGPLGDEGAKSVIAVPMVANEHVMGLIYIQLKSATRALPDTDARFYKIMAGTAANALRNAQLFEETERRARTDFLTGLPNHRTFQATLISELSRAQRHNHPLTLLMIDLDYMKAVNDKYGHPCGDMVLRRVAETIRAACRDADFAARYGGEEFMVILPETPLEGGVQAAERIREQIAAVEFLEIGRVTASVGVANYPANAGEREDLIRIADQALYVAKHRGRDRVVYFNYQLTNS